LNVGGGAYASSNANANSQTNVCLKSVDTSGVDYNSVAAQDFCVVAAEELSADVESVTTSDSSTCCAADEQLGLVVSKNLKVGH
jgi:hypothetical protein